FLHRLLHGHRHFLGLALADAHPAIAVADHGQRGKAENAPALHHLGDAVDADHLLAEAVAALVLLLLPLLHSRHDELSLRQNLRPASRAASASACTRPW